MKKSILERVQKRYGRFGSPGRVGRALRASRAERLGGSHGVLALPLSGTAVLAFLLLLFAGTARAQFGNLEPDYELISSTGQTILDRYAPDAIRKQFDFASPGELASWFGMLRGALDGDDLAALADLQPAARQAPAFLSALPQTQGVADWLSARLDYLDVAAEAVRAIPGPVAPSKPVVPGKPKPSPSTGGKPAAKPTAPPAKSRAELARERYAESTRTWIRRLEKRPAPSRAAALLPVVKAAFRAQGVPEALVWQAEAESSFNPAAQSPVGARGLFQFMPATAREYGLSLEPADERLDPAKSAAAAARYLSRLHDRFGDWSLALAAYNCGPARLSKALARTGARTFAGVQSSLPSETRLYVPKIDALLQLREHTSLAAL